MAIRLVTLVASLEKNMNPVIYAMKKMIQVKCMLEHAV